MQLFDASFSKISPTNRAKIRKSQRARIFLEAFEPRVLLSGTYLPGDLTGTLQLGGLDKAGNITFDGSSLVSAGTWTNQDGSPNTLVVAGSNSTYTMSPQGVVGVNLQTTPFGSTVSSNTSLTGIMNATKDVVALNEITLGLPAVNGLDILVNNTGAFATADLGANWNISAQDFRGTIKINASGHVTGGVIFLESNQKSASITGGTAVLSGGGTGVLTLNTAFTGANSAFATIALNITMNTSKDVVVGNSANIGQPAPLPQVGLAPAELAVLTKAAGTYSSADVVGTSWTINSALGTGSFAFNPGGTISGTLTTIQGVTQTLTGNFALGGNGTLVTNITAKNGNNTTHFSLAGAINRSRNLVVLDRAIANPGTDSSLTLLTSAANHAPTERAQALLPQSAFASASVTIDFPTLLAATQASDFDNDTLSFNITAVPPASGTLSITDHSVTSLVVPNHTVMFSGDTLTWTPAPTAIGQINAFSLQATDGANPAAKPTKITINTAALPVVAIKVTNQFALESKAGTHNGDAKVLLQRVGGDMTQPLDVTLAITGTALQNLGATPNANYQLLGPDGTTPIDTAAPIVTIPAGQSSVTLTLRPLQDNVADPTLLADLTVVSSTSSTYTPALHPTAVVQVIDGDPIVTITPRQPNILEGSSSVNTFLVTRLAAQGDDLNHTLTVNLTYGGTFNTANLFAPASITFQPGETKKIIFTTTTDDHIAEPTLSLTATVSVANTSNNFQSITPLATVNVLDASPIISITKNNVTANEAHPTTNPASFTIHRTGSTTSDQVVNFTTASGGTFGTLGTNYTLTDPLNHNLTTSVTIPQGQRTVKVTLTPTDDGANDPTLHPTITLQADSGPTYHGAGDSVSLIILNDNRPPIVTNPLVNQSAIANTALSLSFSQLTNLMGASLAAGETNGTLQLKVTAEGPGTLQIIPALGGIPIAAPLDTIIETGDTLVWTPPINRHTTTLNAFTLSALDGTLTAAIKTKFTLTIP